MACPRFSLNSLRSSTMSWSTGGNSESLARVSAWVESSRRDDFARKPASICRVLGTAETCRNALTARLGQRATANSSKTGYFMVVECVGYRGKIIDGRVRYDIKADSMKLTNICVCFLVIELRSRQWLAQTDRASGAHWRTSCFLRIFIGRNDDTTARTGITQYRVLQYATPPGLEHLK